MCSTSVRSPADSIGHRIVTSGFSVPYRSHSRSLNTPPFIEMNGRSAVHRSGARFCLNEVVDAGSRFMFLFVRSSGYNSLNSQSVYTLPRAQRGNIPTLRLVTEWMISVCVCVCVCVCVRWSEERMMGVVRSKWPPNNMSSQRWHPLSGRRNRK